MFTLDGAAVPTKRESVEERANSDDVELFHFTRPKSSIYLTLRLKHSVKCERKRPSACLVRFGVRLQQIGGFGALFITT